MLPQEETAAVLVDTLPVLRNSVCVRACVCVGSKFILQLRPVTDTIETNLEAAAAA